jgi:hypothetical protein
MKIDTLPLPSLAASDGNNNYSLKNLIKNNFLLGFDSLNTIIINEKIESSEPCWDGYQVNK